MRVLVTGGTGFTGRRVVRELAERGFGIRCFVRPSSDRAPLAGLPVEFAVGDLSDGTALRAALAGMDALMNVASIGFGHAPGIVAAGEDAGVSRAVFFSTTALFTRLPAPSRAVRAAAEGAIRDSALRWTILRPTMIYGGPGDRNVERLIRTLRRRRWIPVPGRGESRIQPVLVDDLARAAAASLAPGVGIRRAYQLAGREAVTFGDFVRLAGEAVGRRVRLISVPGRLLVAAAGVLEAGGVGPRIRREQVLRLLEDKNFDIGAARRDLGYDPAGVREGLATEVRRLGGERRVGKEIRRGEGGG